MSLAGDLAESRWERQMEDEKRTGMKGLDAKYNIANVPPGAPLIDIQLCKDYWAAREAGSSPEHAEIIARYKAGLGTIWG